MPSLSKSMMVPLAERHYDSEMRKAPPTDGETPFANKTPGSFAPKPSFGTTRSPNIQIGGHRAPPRPPTPPSANPRDAIEPLLDAIIKAVDMWRLQACFVGVSIQGVNAIGGRLDGPPLDIPMHCPQLAVDPAKKAWVDTVSKGVTECWDQFCVLVTVPQLPWYPSFAAFPGPQAPPTPNTPMPLSTCAGVAMSAVSESTLKETITRGQHGLATDVKALYGAIATGLAMGVQTWVMAQQITQALGQGPVPSFAPPTSPVGPVMGGQVIAAPPHLSS